MKRPTLLLSASLLAAGLVLGSCGGGDDRSPVPLTSVHVVGDSLADVGTFGFKFTIQGTQAPLPIFPERLARALGVAPLCNVYQATGLQSFAPNPAAGCTAYAVGGGRIGKNVDPASPLSILQQLQAVSAAGPFGDDDLLLIDGGGNDAADLVAAYLQSPSDSGAAYTALLGTQLAPAVISTQASAGARGLAGAGNLYMTALADSFHAAIKTHLLDKGTTRIAVLNMPGITKTPRFQMVLDSIAAANGGGDAGAAARQQAEALFDGWVQIYNNQLRTRFAGDPRVVVVDFYTAFKDQVARPQQYDLTNVTTPACPATGVDASGLPTYSFPTCTDAALSASPPAGTSGPDWWRRYAFADGFHPTPYGHQLLAQLIEDALRSMGWETAVKIEREVRPS